MFLLHLIDIKCKHTIKANNTSHTKFKSFRIEALTVISVIILLASSFSVSGAFAQPYSLIASTRGSFNLETGETIYQANLPSVSSILGSNNCPGQLAIYVHGVWADTMQAQEQTERVFLSLQKIGYHIPLIGFSWDSNTAFSLDDVDLSNYGWGIAKVIANKNGPLLGKFISDFKDKCPDDKVRIIAHSLGSRVILSAIEWLYDNDPMQNNNNINPSVNKKIASVHLLGAAVNNEQVSENQGYCTHDTPPLKCSGKAIKSEVGHFYNLYDSEDNMLASEEISSCIGLYCTSYTIPSPYQSTENNDPLGAYGKESTSNIPSNYREYSVLSKIINDDDADKVDGCDLQVNLKNFGYPYDEYYCTITKQGDNHFGYMGFRSDTNRNIISNVGAIRSVTSDWSSEGILH